MGPRRRAATGWRSPEPAVLVAAEVVVEVAPGVEVVSVITKHSVESLGIKAGSEVKVMVKATSVMLVTD